MPNKDTDKMVAQTAPSQRLATKLLSQQELQNQLTILPGWSSDNNQSIHASYTFPSFEVAIQFMVKTATVCTQLDHHPDWSNCYNTVKITLSTHSHHGVTTLDTELAGHMNRIARQLNNLDK